MHVADLGQMYWVLAAGISMIVWVHNKKWNLGLLAGYMFLIYADTVLNRVPQTIMMYELIPFWSYGNPEHFKQIIMNVLLFIPVGLLGGNWKTTITAAGYSSLIELSQLVSHRGLFEFDDIIHNTFGAAIGVTILVIIRKIVGVR